MNTFEVPIWNLKAEAEMENTKAEKSSNELVSVTIESKDIGSLIYVIRGQQVMLDSDLAMLYQVETKVFNQAVSRNIERFQSRPLINECKCTANWSIR